MSAACAESSLSSVFFMISEQDRRLRGLWRNLFITGVRQMIRRCGNYPLLHLIPSPFFVAGLEGGGSPRRKIPEAAVHFSAILEPEGDSERRQHLSVVDVMTAFAV